MSLKDKRFSLTKQGKFGPKEIVTDVIFTRDVYGTVLRILKRIRLLPNRDDMIDIKGPRMCVLDGGGVGKFEVLRIVEEETGMKEK